MGDYFGLKTAVSFTIVHYSVDYGGLPLFPAFGGCGAPSTNLAPRPCSCSVCSTAWCTGRHMSDLAELGKGLEAIAQRLSHRPGAKSVCTSATSSPVLPHGTAHPYGCRWGCDGDRGSLVSNGAHGHGGLSLASAVLAQGVLLFAPLAHLRDRCGPGMPSLRRSDAAECKEDEAAPTGPEPPRRVQADFAAPQALERRFSAPQQASDHLQGPLTQS